MRSILPFNPYSEKMLDTVELLHSTVRVKWFDQLDSTSSEAIRCAAHGEKGGLWIVARRQTEGRGRRGRLWVSDTGNLHASILLRFAAENIAESQISFVAAVALFDAIVMVMPNIETRLSFKWPNDLLLDGKKVSGILIECGEYGGNGRAVIVGIGVNCCRSPSGMHYPAANLRSAGFDISSDSLLKAMVVSFQTVLQEWCEYGFSIIGERWIKHAIGIGQFITVRTAMQILVGKFEGLDEEGNLLLLQDGKKLYRITAGDVFFG